MCTKKGATVSKAIKKYLDDSEKKYRHLKGDITSTKNP